MMKSRLQVSRRGVDLIKGFEGLRRTAAQLPDGRWTIGHSHTRTTRDGAEVSEADAEALLLYDLIPVTHALNELVFAPLNQNQFDALTSLAFNIGIDAFRGSSALRRLNEGAYLQAAASMELWRKADFEGERILIDALVRRRAAEKTLFLTPPDGWVPAPSPVLPPRMDFDPGYGLSQTPQVVEAALDPARAYAERREPPAPLLRPVEDDGPTATEQAAAALGARLEALAPDTSPEPSVSPPAAIEPVSATEDAAPEPQAVEPVAPAPVEPEPAPETPAAPEAAVAHVTEPESPPVAHASEGGLTGARLGQLGLLGLASLGVGVFIAAVTYGFQNAGSQGGISDPMTWGWVLGALALTCFGIAAYFLLDRMNGEDDDGI